MNRRECRKIAVWTAVVGVLSFVALSSAQAQLAPIPQTPPNAAAHTPPPNPEPPRTGAAPANTPAEPGYLGIVADDRQEKGAGVRVLDTAAGSPAERAGLKADDLITQINGTPVHDQSDMAPVLEQLPPGSKVKFVVDRGGQQQTVDVTLGNRPPVGQRRYEKFGTIPEPLPSPNAGGGIGPELTVPEPGRVPADAAPSDRPVPGAHADGLVPNGTPNLPSNSEPFHIGSGNFSSHRPLLGVRTRPVTDEARQRLRLSSTNGALVVSRTLGSPAVQAGIPIDAVITAVDGKPIVTPLDLTQLVAQAGAGHEIEITYLFAGSEKRTKVRLAEFAAEPGSLLSGGSVRAGEVPTPPAPQGRLPTPDDKTRIDSLERRVQQLEHRVDDLEQALNKSK